MNLLEFKQKMVFAANEDELFANFFRGIVKLTGERVHGAVIRFDYNGQIFPRLAGRFGVPSPDRAEFSKAIGLYMANKVMNNGQLHVVYEEDLEQVRSDFGPESWFLIGVTAATIPLLNREKNMTIGMIVLYRKGEQPITQEIKAVAVELANTAVEVLTGLHHEE